MDSTENTIYVFDNCADEYQEKFMDMDLYDDTFDLFCNSIDKKNALLLELACGPGNITKYLLQKRPDFKITATDLSLKMLELAKKNNPKADFQMMDCRNIKSLSQTFDGIMCGFALPYLSKKEGVKLIADAFEILNLNGILYLSTMEDDHSKSGFKKSSSGKYQAYINYHEADYLSEALVKSGFKIISMTRKDFLQNDGTVTKDLILIARK
ncbi:trans-aconitate 2-methyltransferase [uncultured Flavobacterium sp.]|uniref:class I SAM-dependent methyltransferase n=1 Tax=uncultured Flavobacterium sp. TaxID=165435 RepID=UPI0025DBCD8D|nr:class I SAM-dependent methyltransferase [uncultured Flavobacterium sp.]